MMNFSDDEDPWVSSSIASTDVTMDACSNAHSDDSLPDSEGLQVTSGMCLFREDRLPMSEKEDFCFNYLQGCKQSGSSFPTRAFAEEECEWVTKLPGDINGFTVYKIKTTEIEWKHVMKDHWYFTMASSKWKFFNGKRKVGKCEGSFSCGFGKCPFFKDNHTANKVHSLTVEEKNSAFPVKDLQSEQSVKQGNWLSLTQQQRWQQFSTLDGIPATQSKQLHNLMNTSQNALRSSHL